MSPHALDCQPNGDDCDRWDAKQFAISITSSSSKAPRMFFRFEFFISLRLSSMTDVVETADDEQGG